LLLQLSKECSLVRKEITVYEKDRMESRQTAC
ncbi:MAG: hypothetical protein K0S30_1061, partial [Clostridia bacterium]|nr:hypothetical protein [Clostridia bacterium]